MTCWEEGGLHTRCSVVWSGSSLYDPIRESHWLDCRKGEKPAGTLVPPAGVTARNVRKSLKDCILFKGKQALFGFMCLT